MSSFDIPKQFGDPQWSSKYQNQNNIGNKRENREVNNGVKKQDAGAFGDLKSSMNASDHYAKQLQEAGKSTQRQIATEYKNWLGDPNKANLLTVLRTHHEAMRQIKVH